MVAHSVELLFDPDTDDAIRRGWAALAEAGLPSQASHRSPSNRPHVTVAVSDRIDPTVDEDLRAAELPLACQVGAPIVFGAKTFTLARLIVPTDELLGFQGFVVAACEPLMPRGPYPHGVPGHWTPHVTLARRMSAADVAAALAILDTGDLRGEFIGLRRWDGDARVATTLR